MSSNSLGKRRLVIMELTCNADKYVISLCLTISVGRVGYVMFLIHESK